MSLFEFQRLPDPTIVEWLATNGVAPSVWYRLADSVPFMGGDWTWHKTTMAHLQHPFYVRQRWRLYGPWCDTLTLNGHQHSYDDNVPTIVDSISEPNDDESESLCKIVKIGGDVKVWYKNDLLHRGSDLPAIESSDGHREWWCRGERHRDNDQPAIVYTNGFMEWWRHSRLYTPNSAIRRKNGHTRLPQRSVLW